MSPLFTCIVIIMGLLAVMGIVVGVANDAVNFLNSALGSKVARGASYFGSRPQASSSGRSRRAA